MKTKPLPGTEELKEKLRVFDAIGFTPGKRTLKQILKIDSLAEEILFYFGILGIVIFMVFIAFWVCRILPRIPAKLDSDAAIPTFAKTQTEAQVKLANISERQAQDVELLRESVQSLERQVYGLRLDYEWKTRRRRNHIPLSPSILNE